MTDDHPDQHQLITAFEELLPGQGDLAEDLLQRYAEPHRRYHTATHLAEVLSWIDELAVVDSDLYSVRLAAWFHDAVYRVKGVQISNEEASARLVSRELALRGFEQEEMNEIARLVRLTESHAPGPADPSGDLLCDADLAILAAEPERYAEYRRQIREEHAELADAEFAAGRLAVLQRFGGTMIFRTTAGRRLNEPAQANLEAEARALIDQFDLVTDGWPLDTDDHPAAAGTPSPKEKR